MPINSILDIFNKTINSPTVLHNELNNEWCNRCDCERYPNDNYYICMNCGEAVDSLVFDNYIDPRDIIRRYPYKQVNHFRYKLLKLAGNDNQPIPDHVINKLKSIEYETIHQLHDIMKQNKFNEYFKNIILIDYKIKHKLCHDIDTTTFYNFIEEFRRIQAAFYDIPGNPVQMINYNYLIFKLCMLYNRPDIAKNIFFICKYNNTIQKYDNIWYGICKRLGYRYGNTFDELKQLIRITFNNSQTC